MKFLKKNIWTICSWAFVFALVAGNAFAEEELMSTAQHKARNVFTSVRTITFILGGFGLVGIAYQAIIS
jgi:hypothetical protein